ncbi:hypothetical protein FACS1894199_18690 [Bacteroidia bacterium]|nr:hypothetical protein FACS1894199_18690 [Bacteroidia bacterium]
MIDIIRNIIDKFELGYIFTIGSFDVSVKNPVEVSRILNHFVREGYLCKFSKGRYYKPKNGLLGNLNPDSYQTVKDLLVENGKPIGYLTGYSIFNQFNLTTQVSAVLQIGTQKDKKTVKRGVYRIIFIKQKNTITKENIPLLQLLDCLRFFKIVPDAVPDSICGRLLDLLSQLTDIQTNKIKRLALKYSPQTMALLGAMLETLDKNEDTTLLFKKLNPITSYQLYISPTILPTQKKWHIK